MAAVAAVAAVAALAAVGAVGAVGAVAAVAARAVVAGRCGLGAPGLGCAQPVGARGPGGTIGRGFSRG